MILRFAQAKDEGLLDKLFVMGCLSQRYREELSAEIPQVDKFYGKFDFKDLIDDLGAAKGFVCEKATVSSCADGSFKQKTTPAHYSYIKSVRDVTVIVRIVPYLSSQESTRAAQWKI